MLGELSRVWRVENSTSGWEGVGISEFLNIHAYNNHYNKGYRQMACGLCIYIIWVEVDS